MATSSRVEEDIYLDFVKLNIELKKDEILNLLKTSAVGGAGPKGGRNIAESLLRKKENLPSLNEPYFVRVDLSDGQIIYYGLGTLSQAKSSPAIPETHRNIEHFLTYHRNNDGSGKSVLPINDFPDVVRRIKFQIKNGKILKLEEERNSSVKASTPKILAEEYLEDAISSTRSDSLQPVGATLQPDQFNLIRASANTVFAVQGPPGSGKTVVLLERLSRIAFADPATKKKGMLLIGPNQQFLEYVKDALEILGNSDIIMSTPEELTSWKTSEELDPESIQYLKGFSQISNVIDNYFKNAPSVLDDSYQIKIGDIEVQFSVLDSLDIISSLRIENTTYSHIRARAGLMISNLAAERFFRNWEKLGRQRRQYDGDPLKAIQATSTYRTILRNMFPELNPEGVLKDLKKSAKHFLANAKSVFDEVSIREWLTHVTPKEFDIRENDVPLLDYIKFRIDGIEETWGHIAIDEAQDLTPMQLGMLRRRTDATSSLSLTGDLAQATGVIVYEKWTSITRYLSDDEPTQEKLVRSYRVPAEILDYANQFLELAEVSVDAAEPFLERPDSLQLHYREQEQDAFNHVETLIKENLRNQRSVLLVANSSTVARFRKVNFDSIGKAHFKAYLAQDVKGLEFDTVIVLYPNDILKGLGYSIGKAARLMYVLTTRATKQLFVIGRSAKESRNPLEIFINGSQDQNTNIFTLEQMEYHLPDLEVLNQHGPSSIELKDTSLPVLCSKFNMQISTKDPEMLEEGWYYLGLSQNTRCVSCNFKQQQVFRRHLVGDGKISHPAALVCLGCLVARKSSNYRKEALDSIDNELLNGVSIESVCEECPQ